MSGQCAVTVQAVALWVRTVIECSVREDFGDKPDPHIQVRGVQSALRCVWPGWRGIPESGPLPKPKNSSQIWICVPQGGYNLEKCSGKPSLSGLAYSEMQLGMHRKNEQEVAPKYWCGHLWVGELWEVFFPSNFYESEHFICKMLALSPPLPLYYLLLCTQWLKPGLAGSWGGGHVFTSAALRFPILLGSSEGGSRQYDEWWGRQAAGKGLGGGCTYKAGFSGWQVNTSLSLIPEVSSFLCPSVLLLWKKFHASLFMSVKSNLWEQMKFIWVSIVLMSMPCLFC